MLVLIIGVCRVGSKAISRTKNNSQTTATATPTAADKSVRPTRLGNRYQRVSADALKL
jgi:hypothetical protein